ncbi:MAG: EAL domain-containing protein, partial [Olsenella sp.]|nr:EAL domain-containing protein [Olsenella sp.]
MDRFQFDESDLALMEGSVIPFAIYQFIEKRVVTLVLSAGFCETFGFDDRDEAYYVMDHDMYRDAHPDDISRIADAALRFAVDDGNYEVVYRSKAPHNDKYSIVHAHGRHVYTSTGVRLAVVWYMDEGFYSEVDGEGPGEMVGDSLGRVLREAGLLSESRYDVLTGLPSMAYFFELAEAARPGMLARGEREAILFVDLNGMKNFNRRYGFAEGNKLLRAIAKVLVRHFSNENCSRLGQDHFAVFTHDAELEDRLRHVLDDCARANGGRSLPVRVGIYLDEYEHVEVSAACDRAKMVCDLHRGTLVSSFAYFDDELQTRAARRTYITENLDRAIDEGWIQAYYQPIARAADGEVCNREALARWVDPALGVMAPGEVIPVLEEVRLIHRLDLCIVDRVLADIVRAQRAGRDPVPVSVNLSRVDFDACDVVEEIRRRVDEAGVRRRMLNIEITESVVGRDFGYVKEQVRRFHELGFSVWMDDFGSGYSSLDVLQQFDFDLIK